MILPRRRWPFRRVVVLGGAGFLGTHVCSRLLSDGSEVVAVDSLLTGSTRNIEALPHPERLQFISHDICEPFDVPGPIDTVMHLASPASPADYLQYPFETLRAGSAGTLNAIELASRKDARLLYASTSEVYGDPTVHPQPECYQGNVSTTGPRAVYDEAKRFGEAAVSAATRTGMVDARIARIFNTVGPLMRLDDGRVVPSFVSCVLGGTPIRIRGDGTQTRAITDVRDTVEGLMRLVASDHTGPVNIGNPEEHTVIEIAHWVKEALGRPDTPISYVAAMEGDPLRRCPDISLAQSLLDWRPAISAREAVSDAARSLTAVLGRAG